MTPTTGVEQRRKGEMKSLRLVVDPALTQLFFGILQIGFRVEACVGESVRTVLCGQLGLTPEYVSERISTIFLDGKPVDDIDAAIIREGSTLALSSAMPGLVGATLRREGFLRSLRSAITYREEGQKCREREALFSLKLFNLLMAELGPLFLERGIYVRSTDLSDLFRHRAGRFIEGCRECLIDGQVVPPATLSSIDWSAMDEWIHVAVCESR
jgi:hypothetical protein